MSGYAAARLFAEPQSDAAEEPLGAAPSPPRPWRAAAALCAAALLVGAVCSAAAGAGEGTSALRPAAPRGQSARVLDFVSKVAAAGAENETTKNETTEEAETVEPPCYVQPAGSGFSVEDATKCSEDLREMMKDANGTAATGIGSYNDTDHEITVRFNVKSTTDIDTAAVSSQLQALQNAARVVLGAAIPLALPHENTRSCMYTLVEKDELHVNCEFTVCSADDSKAVWEACMSASNSEGSIAGELGFLEGPTVTDVLCAKNALVW